MIFSFASSDSTRSDVGIRTKDKNEEVQISPDGNVKDLIAAVSAEDHARASAKEDNDDDDA